MSFRDDEWALRIDGGYDNLWQFCVNFSVLSCNKSAVPGWWNPLEGIYNHQGFVGESIVRQIREVQRKPLPAFSVFQMLTTQNHQYTKVVDLGMACSELLQPYFEVAYSATLQRARELSTWKCRMLNLKEMWEFQSYLYFILWSTSLSDLLKATDFYWMK